LTQKRTRKKKKKRVDLEQRAQDRNSLQQFNLYRRGLANTKTLLFFIASVPFGIMALQYPK
jgi:hypothetical protein